MINDGVLASHALIGRGRYEAIDPFGWTQPPAHYVTTDRLGNNYFTIFVCDVRGIFTATSKDYAEGDAMRSKLGGAATVSSLIVTLQVLHCEEPLTPVLQSCVSVPQPSSPLHRNTTVGSFSCEPFRHGNRTLDGVECSEHHDVQLLDEWFVFPLRLCDLPLDGVVDCRVHDAEGGACLGFARFHPFNLYGELRVGRLACELQFTGGEKRGEGKLNKGLHEAISYEEQASGAHSVGFSTLSSFQQRSLGESLLRARFCGMLLPIPWLDAITEDFLYREACLDTLPEVEEGGREVTSSGSEPSQDYKRAHLQLYLPLSSEPIPILMRHAPRRLFPEGLNTPHSMSIMRNAYAANATTPYVDHYYFFKSHNVCEAMAAVQARSLNLFYDTTAVPGGWERQRLSELAARPPIQLDSLCAEDVALLWKYRHFACKNPRLFLSFVRTVDWSQPNSAEGRAAADLIVRWKPVCLAEVLCCLSAAFSGVAPVRRLAVRLLNRESDAKLCRLSVFLVQALRYESKHKELTHFLIRRAVYHWELCCTLYWGGYVEGALDKKANGGLQECQQSAISTFSRHLEDELARVQPPFLCRLQRQLQLVASMRELCSKLQQAPIDRQAKIELGKKLLDEMGCGFDRTFERAGDTTVLASSKTVLRVGLTDGGVSGSSGRPSILKADPLHTLGMVTLPCHPAIALKGVSSSGFSIFKSSKLPVQIVFLPAGHATEALHPPREGAHGPLSPRSSTHGDGLGPHREVATKPGVGGNEHPQDPEAAKGAATEARSLPNVCSILQAELVFKPMALTTSLRASSNPQNTIAELPLIFKFNDDVRQDQLISQLVCWMDSFLRQDGLDLCLTPYLVVTTGPNEGLIEVVPNAVTFQSVQRDVLKYFLRHNPTSAGFQEAMDRYKRSFAGNCVITFVLGIGDRHLENILVAQDGRMFHIDFGYILGNDPKPFPPPMKISREMIDVLGGPQSVGYTEFKSYCCSAYNILRKHAALFLHMLQLMDHACTLPQITGNGIIDPRFILLQVQDKLRLGLSNAQAAQYLQTVIADSVGSLFTGLWDVLHAAAQATRV